MFYLRIILEKMENARSYGNFFFLKQKLFMVKTAFISLLFSDDPCKVKVSSLLIQGLNFLTFRLFYSLRCRANAPDVYIRPFGSKGRGMRCD